MGRWKSSRLRTVLRVPGSSELCLSMKETVIGGTPSAPSHSSAEEAGAKLLALIRKLLLESRRDAPAGRGISLDSRLDEDLGLDSLARVELILRIERAFAVRLPE